MRGKGERDEGWGDGGERGLAQGSALGPLLNATGVRSCLTQFLDCTPRGQTCLKFRASKPASSVAQF